MTIPADPNDKSDYIAMLYADSAILASLIALQASKTSDADKAIETYRSWVQKSMANLYANDSIPERIKTSIERRVNSVFDIATHLKV